jgi:hypothetical protein
MNDPGVPRDHPAPARPDPRDRRTVLSAAAVSVVGLLLAFLPLPLEGPMRETVSEGLLILSTLALVPAMGVMARGVPRGSRPDRLLRRLGRVTLGAAVAGLSLWLCGMSGVPSIAATLGFVGALAAVGGWYAIGAGVLHATGRFPRSVTIPAMILGLSFVALMAGAWIYPRFEESFRAFAGAAVANLLVWGLAQIAWIVGLCEWQLGARSAMPATAAAN